MVLTRQQAKARGACAENHRDGDDCAVEPDRIQHDDGTQRQVLQARNTHTTHKDMQGSARKGLQSWPLGGDGGGVGGGGRRLEEALADVVAAGPVAMDVDSDGKVVAPVSVNDNLPTGPEPPRDPSQIVDLYPSRADFTPVPADQLAAVSTSITENIASTNWTTQVAAMNELRRLAVHHGDVLDGLLLTETTQTASRTSVIITAIAKAIKSPRSNVSKSAILTVRDLFELAPARMGEVIGKDPVDATSSSGLSLLSVLLTKAASNDKKFVVDEAVGALEVMCRCVDGRVVLAPALAGAIEHKNPKVRGRCFVLLQALFCDGDRDRDRGLAVDRLVDDEGVLRRLVVACDRGSTDNTPEAREGARAVLCAVFGGGTGGFEGVSRLMEGGLARTGGGGGGDGDGEGGEGDGPLLERYVAMALGNRGRAVLLMEKKRV